MKKIVFSILLFISTVAVAQIENAVPNPPNPPRLVVDNTGTLSPDQQETLERKLVAYDDSTSNQIVVVIIPTTGDYDISDYALTLGRKWGVGNKEFSNGIVFLVAKNDRKVFIAPGYGLEGAVPDITAKQIIENEVVPNFKGNDFYRGIDYGVDALIKAAQGEYKAPAGYGKGKGKGKIPVFAIFIIIIVIIMIFSRMGGGGGSFMSRRGHRGFGGPPIWWFPTGGGGSGGGGWGGGGSSGGGGFGGFGGGSFGGGGAGGSW
jgi:uncharacterized protein